MDLVARINTLLWTWIQSLRSVKRISLFFPFLLFAALQVGVLLLLIFFYLPPVSALMIPLIRFLSREPALHYPQFYFFLPGLFSQINGWVLTLFIGWLFIGMATLMFGGWYRGKPMGTGQALSGAFRRFFPLFVVGCVEWLVARGVMKALQLLSTSAGDWAARSPRLFLLLGFLISIAFITPFAYTSAEVVLGGRGIAGALRGSFTLARRNYGLTYILFAVPSLLTLAMNLVFQYAPAIVTRASPSVMVSLMIVDVLVTVVVNFAIVGALTALYLRVAE